VNCVVQVAVAPAPLSVHAVKEPDPLGVVAKVTVPVGVIGVLLVSVTVAVQVVAVLTARLDGEQLTEVVVDFRTESEVLPELDIW